MESLFAVLLSWAVSLSSYPFPMIDPEVVKMPHSFFVDNACGGNECRVYGWYAGGTRVYVDEQLDIENNLVSASVLVHEYVHYLQGMNRNNGHVAIGAAFGEKPGCIAAIEMEREAYLIQNLFLLKNGNLNRMGVSMERVSCE